MRMRDRIIHWLDNNPYTHDPAVFFTGMTVGVVLTVLLGLYLITR